MNGRPLWSKPVKTTRNCAGRWSRCWATRAWARSAWGSRLGSGWPGCWRPASQRRSRCPLARSLDPTAFCKRSGLAVWAKSTAPGTNASTASWRSRLSRPTAWPIPSAASALNHPNIVTFYDLAAAGECEFLVMEHVAGKTLDRVIPKHGLRLREALRYAIQMADALAAAHAAGVIHRDLKPGNIMITEAHVVKLLDFGLAKLAHPSEPESASESVTQPGMILGTAAYMSPEQAEGKKLDARSDIFSFGSVLYEMLTGRRPFQGDSTLSTLAALAWFLIPALKRPEAAMAAVPLTSYPGREWFPAFSPDGKQVAFSWNGESQDNSDIYVQLIGSGRPLRLTNDPMQEFAPAWSPDGRHIAFLRELTQEKWGVFLVPPLGGPERKLAEVSAGEVAESGVAWSPDSRWLVTSDRDSPEKPLALFLVSVETGEKRRLTSPPMSLDGGDLSAAFSPDGRTLAFSRVSSPWIKSK